MTESELIRLAIKMREAQKTAAVIQSYAAFEAVVKPEAQFDRAAAEWSAKQGVET